MKETRPVAPSSSLRMQPSSSSPSSCTCEDVVATPPPSSSQGGYGAAVRMRRWNSSMTGGAAIGRSTWVHEERDEDGVMGVLDSRLLEIS